MKIAVGLSGGVDSAVAAALLKAAGHDVVGVTMRLWKPGRYKGGADGSCFGPGEEASIAAAAALAETLAIPYRVFDVNADYERTIIGYFRDTYLAGRTPNPCVRCNAEIKFGLLPRLARDAGLAFDRFATGHYARIRDDRATTGRLALLRARDTAKDQSYFLHRLTQAQLAGTLFPLGEMTKDEVRDVARAEKLSVADRPDSQDFCSGGTDDLIGAADRAGNIVDLSGRILGRHNGFWHYTIGQRKGLGIGGAGEPYYVVELDACGNRVIVGRADDAVKTELTVTNMNFVTCASTAEPVSCRVKVRSNGRLVPATLQGNVCAFPSGIAGVAPGQSAVFYAAEGDEVLCGGEIASADGRRA